jgi:hypothetical protein
MNYNSRRHALFLVMTCCLCLAGHVEAKTRDASATPSDGGSAHLTVYRTPATGKFVIVQIYDGDAMLGSVSYGGTFEGSLTPGRHVLSALATPRPKWRERPPTTVDVRSGQTYKFTAVGNGQGNLVLVPAG